MFARNQITIIEVFVGLFLLILSSGVLAEQEPVEDVPTKPVLERVESPDIKHYLGELSGMQSYVGGYVQSFGEGLDRFFGSEDLTVVSKRNQLKIQTPITFYQGGKTNSEINFKFQIDLPRTNHKWKLFITSFDEDEESQNNSEILERATDTRNVTDDNANRIGGRYILNSEKNRFSNIDTGLKFIGFIEPNPFIKYQDRYKKDLYDDLKSRTTHTLYLEREDGFAWEGEQVFDKKLTAEELLRSQSKLTWWRKDKQLLMNQRFTYFSQPNPFRANAYYLDARWIATDYDAVDFNSVAVGLNWRERLYQDWLFFEIEPKTTWYQADDRLTAPQYSLRFMLEMRFYRS